MGPEGKERAPAAVGGVSVLPWRAERTGGRRGKGVRETAVQVERGIRRPQVPSCREQWRGEETS